MIILRKHHALERIYRLGTIPHDLVAAVHRQRAARGHEVVLHVDDEQRDVASERARAVGTAPRRALESELARGEHSARRHRVSRLARRLARRSMPRLRKDARALDEPRARMGPS